MKVRLFLSGLAMLMILESSAQSPETNRGAFVDIPFSVSGELPGVHFMNFQDLNTSDQIVASLYNTDYMPGVGLNFGPRQKFYVSFGIAGRSYQKFANYSFYNPIVNDHILASASVLVIQRKYNITCYKSLFNFKRSVLYGFAGWQGNRTTIYGWEYNSNSYDGIIASNFQIRQDWNADLGLMYDFLKSTIIGFDFSIGIRAGYSVPLAKPKWFDAAGQVERVEKTNSAGAHIGLVLTVL